MNVERNPVMRDLLVRERLHNPPAHPHWSLAVLNWPAERWDAMTTAPSRGYPILHVRGRDKDGKVLEPMHYACGDGDGLMPPFDGWFVPVGRLGDGKGFTQVFPVEWQPLSAATEAASS